MALSALSVREAMTMGKSRFHAPERIRLPCTTLSGHVVDRRQTL